jgi:hypothetical protein
MLWNFRTKKELRNSLINAVISLDRKAFDDQINLVKESE